MVIQNIYCEKCGIKYINKLNKWCTICKVSNITNCASGDKRIDEFIQGMKLDVEYDDDIIVNIKVFEWIPYNQFNNIKEIIKNSYVTVYSAIWKDGPLVYNHIVEEFVRYSDGKVILKCLYNSQNMINDVLDKV